MGLRVGAGTWGIDGLVQDERYVTVPVLVQTRLDGGRGSLEAGGGVLLGRHTLEDDGHTEGTMIRTLTGFFGYRNQPPDGGFVFRTGVVLFYGLGVEDNYPDDGFLPWVGLSAGYAF